MVLDILNGLNPNWQRPARAVAESTSRTLRALREDRELKQLRTAFNARPQLSLGNQAQPEPL